MAPRVELFTFRYRDPRTGKWNRARYVATREENAAARWRALHVAFQSITPPLLPLWFYS